ncbi:hypothetical protein JL720_5083 [Aureococcus anophagefferens]|nr:hypothetical protein JL720_5083 [Aureococcus anophagefferens]
MPKRLEKALQVLDTSNDGEVDVEEWEEAIYRGLSKRLEQLSIERERRERAAAADDEEFTAEFLSAARQVFDMIDVDQSGSLDKAEVIKAIQHNDEVIAFLINCGNQNLQYASSPRARVGAGRARHGPRRRDQRHGVGGAAETALANKLEARGAEGRERRAQGDRGVHGRVHERGARWRDDREGDSGTLTKKEIKRAVQTNDEVISFLKTRGEAPLDIEEWEEAIYRGLASRVAHLGEERERRERAARAEDEFTMEFLMARAGPAQAPAEPAAAPPAAPAVVEIVDASGNVVYVDQATGKKMDAAPEGATITKAPAVAAAPVVAAAAAPAVVEIVDASGNVVVDQATGKKTDAPPEGATITKAPVVAAAPPAAPAPAVAAAPAPVPAVVAAAPAVMESVGESGQSFFIDLATGAKLETAPEGAAVTKAAAPPAPAPVAAAAPAVMESVDESGQTFFIDLATGAKMARARPAPAIDEDTTAGKLAAVLDSCAHPELLEILEPKSLAHTMNVTDTSNPNEIEANEWEDAIESALARKLAARKAEREAEELIRQQLAKAAEEEEEAFANEFMNAARKCFAMIDKDGSGTLTKVEIVEAVKEDRSVVHFLRTCGEDNLQFLLQPARLEKALEVLDTSKDGEVDEEEWEEAVNRGLEKRLAALKEEQARRDRAAQAADTEFAVPSRLNAALAELDTDRDGEINATEWEGAIESALAAKLEQRASDRAAAAKRHKREIEEFTADFLSGAALPASSANDEVIDFLVNCGEDNLQFLLKPKRLSKARRARHVQGRRARHRQWEEAIYKGLASRVDTLRRSSSAATARPRPRSAPSSPRRSSPRPRDLRLRRRRGAGTLTKAELLEALQGQGSRGSAVAKLVSECEHEALVALVEPDAMEKSLAKHKTLDADSIEANEWEALVESALKALLREREKQKADDEAIFGEGWDAADRPVTPGADEKDPNAMPDDLAALDAEKNAHANAEKPPTPRRTIRGANGQEISVHPDDEVFVEKFFANALATFKLIDLDDNGGMTFEEIQESIAEEPDVDKDGEISRAEWDVAIQAALAIRLKRFEHQRARRRRRGRGRGVREEFKKMARKVFFLIDTDGSGTLTVDEIMRGVRYEPEVKQFLETCGSKVLTMLLEPKALKQAMAEIDKNTDGEISVDEWDMIIDMALNDKLEKLRADRAKRARPRRRPRRRSSR